MSEEIPFIKRYIYNLDSEILESLKTLYFDSLTFEQRSHEEFIQRRKDEIVDTRKNTNITNIPQIIQPKPRVDITKINQALSKLNISKSENVKKVGTDTVSESDSDKSDAETESESESEIPENETEILDDKLKLNKIAEDDNSEYESTISFMTTKSPMVLFESSFLKESKKCFGIYKTSIDAVDSPNFNPLKELKSITYNSDNPMPKDPVDAGMSALFMLSSGHFAGAIVSHLPHPTKGNKGTAAELQMQSVRLLTHKTFHRYTTRRKQGGSQSAMDDSKGKANSAGSTLRRYNEQALGKDIEYLLDEWKPLLDQCSSIFIRGSGKGGKNARGTGLIVRNAKDPKAIIKTGDKRIKYLPFATKRPTTNELKRAWLELSYLKIVELPAIEKGEIEKRRKKNELLNQSKANPSKGLNVDSNTVDIKTSNEIISLLKKSKAPALISYMRKNKISADYKFHPEEHYRFTPTPLHYAAKHGLSFMAQTLIVQLHADPTILNEFGKTAYDICQDDATKFSFRLARNIIGEDNEIWKNSNVEKGMSAEDIEKAKEVIKSKKEQTEKNETENLKQQHDLVVEEFRNEQKSKKKTGTLLGGPGIVRVTEEQKLSGLSDAQRMKILREQRFRAIEARLNKQKEQSK